MATQAFKLKKSMSMSVQKSQVHKMAKRSQDDDNRLCLVDDLKEVQVHIQVKLKRTSSSLKSKDHYAYHKMDAMTMKIGAQYKEIQSRAKCNHCGDFIILEMEEENKVPLILGRPFLHTAHAVIRVKQKQLNLGVGSERTIFSINSAMKHSYSNDDTCFSIDVIDEILEEDFDDLLDEGSKFRYSIEGTPLEDRIFVKFDEFIAMNIGENTKPKNNEEEIPFEKITFNTDYKINKTLDEPPTDLQLKPLPDHLEYAFLEEPSFLPVIISSQLSEQNKNKFISILKRHKQAFAWKTTDIPVGVVLGQKDRKHYHPTYFASKTLNAAQQNYTVIEKELIDVVFAFDKFLPYLVLSKTVVYTNHSALRHLFKKQDAKPCLIGWILLLQEFDIELKDKKGTKNVATDHLSRIENDETSDDDDEIDNNFPDETLMKISAKEIPWFADFANYLAGDIIPKRMTYQQKNKFFSDHKKYFWEDPHLFKVCSDGMIQSCVSGPETRIILDQYHYRPIDGHYGPTTTAKKF
ncbi:reverse transcriptase domain-containing protein [Tanacetum coccineum]